MPNALKQFGAKVTASLNGRFHQAQVRLTLVYVLIVAAILFISSYTIYSTFSHQLEHRFRGALVNRQIEMPRRFILPDGTSVTTPRPQDVRADLVRTMLLANGILLLIAAIFSYWLAGATLEPIQEAYERQRRFLSDASHELRTPLTILKTDLENELEEAKTKGVARERAESHLEEVERMSRLVGDLLSLSRLDEEYEMAEKGEWELVATLKEVIERFRPIAAQHAVSINFEPFTSTVLFQGKRESFQQAFSNILKNAIFYNHKNGSVTVTTKLEEGQVKVIVADTGIGIAQADLHKIFDRFYRVDKSRSRQSGGSGLGLAIAQAAMEKLGGSIYLTSELGKGTVVTLILPRSSTS